MTTVTFVVPLKIRQWGGRKAIIAPDGASLTPDQVQNGAIRTRGDPALVKALARAHRWRRMLEAGPHGNIRELAKAEKVNETYISRALRLTLLAPEMVEAILDGRQPEGMTLPGLMAAIAIKWRLQGGPKQEPISMIPSQSQPAAQMVAQGSLSPLGARL